MKRNLAAILILLVTAAAAYAAAMDIPEGSKCRLCGMKVDPASSFSAQAIVKSEMLPFCDIGDMLYFYNKQDDKPSEAYVRDMRSQKWTAAEDAVFVKSESFDTPMGWGIAAFSEREEAAKFGAPMSFKEALDSLGATKSKMKMHK